MSAFRGKGKKSAWQTWDVCPEASDVFTKLSCYPTDVEEDDTVMLEKFVVTMYDRSSSTVAVEDARLELVGSLLPEAEILRRYSPNSSSSCSAHQTRYIPGSRALVCQPEEESPAEWGSKQQGDCWSTLWSVAQSCKQLTKCQCKTQCRGRCNCYKFG